MKIRRFLADDMRTALKQVREELGDEAVILSSRTLDAGSELIVAVDYDAQAVVEAAGSEPLPDSYEARAAASATAAGPISASGGGDRPRRPQRAPEDAEADEVTQLKRELASLRLFLEEELVRLAPGDRPRGTAGVIARRLARLGFSERFVLDLVAEVPADADRDRAWRRALASLAGRIAVPDPEQLELEGVIALVGPTGVGKSTTVAKLAARHALRHGPESVALVTTDSYRIGARAQLETFAELLGVTLRTARSGVELSRVLAEERARSLVLIDNAGLSPRDLRVASQQAELAAVPLIRTYLTLAATGQASHLEQVLDAYGSAPVAGCILTKVDEALLGPALELLVRHRMPVAWFCDGQRVPEDLQRGEAAGLVRRAVENARSRDSGVPSALATARAEPTAQRAEEAR